MCEMTTPSHVTVRGSVAELHISSHNMPDAHFRLSRLNPRAPALPPPHPVSTRVYELFQTPQPPNMVFINCLKRLTPKHV